MVGHGDLDLGLTKEDQINYHRGRVIGLGRRSVADVAEVMEEEEPHHPEEAAHYEDHDHKTRVQGTVHLGREHGYLDTLTESDAFLGGVCDFTVSFEKFASL